MIVNVQEKRQSLWLQIFTKDCIGRTGRTGSFGRMGSFGWKGQRRLRRQQSRNLQLSIPGCGLEFLMTLFLIQMKTEHSTRVSVRTRGSGWGRKHPHSWEFVFSVVLAEINPNKASRREEKLLKFKENISTGVDSLCSIHINKALRSFLTCKWRPVLFRFQFRVEKSSVLSEVGPRSPATWRPRFLPTSPTSSSSTRTPSELPSTGNKLDP